MCIYISKLSTRWVLNYKSLLSEKNLNIFCIGNAVEVAYIEHLVSEFYFSKLATNSNFGRRYLEDYIRKEKIKKKKKKKEEKIRIRRKRKK